MRIPRGELVRSRVVTDPGAVLSTALDRELTGYVVVEPQDALLLDGETRGVLTFEAGVPVLAYEADTDSGGPTALGALGVPGPYSVDLFELDAAALADPHEADALRVPPGMPAERLAGDADLAERTRAAAPADRPREDADSDPVAAFLADDVKIQAIRREAREEARERAAEWGLTDHLGGDDTDSVAGDGTDHLGSVE